MFYLCCELDAAFTVPTCRVNTELVLFIIWIGNYLENNMPFIQNVILTNLMVKPSCQKVNVKTMVCHNGINICADPLFFHLAEMSLKFIRFEKNWVRETNGGWGHKILMLSMLRLLFFPSSLPKLNDFFSILLFRRISEPFSSYMRDKLVTEVHQIPMTAFEVQNKYHTMASVGFMWWNWTAVGLISKPENEHS